MPADEQRVAFQQGVSPMRNRNRIRHTLLAVAVLALTLAQPALAMSSADMGDEPAAVPMAFDILLMRPLGLLMTGFGTLVYLVPVAPIMLVTRPTEITKPIGYLIGAPARFTFKDPIGHHPQPE
jgi:hypothetical protein